MSHVTRMNEVDTHILSRYQHLVCHTNVNESCHTYEWVMSYVWMRYVMYMNESWMSHVTRVKDVDTHVLSRYQHLVCHTYMNESWYAYEWVLSQAGMTHVTHVNDSCHWCKWFMSHMWTSYVTFKRMRHVTHMNEACHTYGRVILCVWMRHVTRRNELCHTYEWAMSHVRMTHITRIT